MNTYELIFEHLFKDMLPDELNISSEPLDRHSTDSGVGVDLFGGQKVSKFLTSLYVSFLRYNEYL